MDKPEIVGRVGVYAVARLVRTPGASMTAEAIILDYHAWCRRLNYIPFRDGFFRSEFARVAAALGFDREVNDADEIYIGVAIKRDV
ncbi:MAG: hypothetical protein ABL893_08910 [Hyphomicrobium sp.]|nr:hypothetical protein [Hyphomicrobium sp.]